MKAMAFAKTMFKQDSGMKKPPTKGRLGLKIILVLCTSKGKAVVKTMFKQKSGLKRHVLMDIRWAVLTIEDKILELQLI